MTSIDLPYTFLERAVYVPAADTLVVADLHFGRGVASNVQAPLAGGADTIDRLRENLESVEPDTVVVAGDLLHSFSRVPRGVKKSISDLERVVDDADATLVVTPGNHDTMLEEVYDGEVPIEHRLADGETVVVHGHEPPSTPADRYIIGHDHPALSVEGRKRPCFLYGPGCYDDTDVLVLPAFSRIARGSTINGMRSRDFQSPLITTVDRFHPGVRDDATDETLWFPPLGDCRDLL